MALKLSNYIKHLFPNGHPLVGGMENLSLTRQHLIEALLHSLGHSKHIDADVAGEISWAMLNWENIAAVDLFKVPP